VVISVVAVVAIVIAPRIDPRSAWVDYQTLAGSLSLKNVDHFDWTQRYGPLNWPRDARTVFTVNADHADYWKVRDLEVFDGNGWAAEPTNVVASAPAPSPAAVARWSQTIQVTIEAMKTPFVVAAGNASAPAHVPEGYTPGLTAGTWVAGATLGPGASYTVKTYSPRPTADELGAIETSAYSAAGTLAGDLSIDLPVVPPNSGASPPEVTFLPFHSPRAVVALEPGEANAMQAIESSPYEHAFQLARSLAFTAPTPYAYVQSVMRYLAHGFTYDEQPPPSRYPLESFLFKSKHGYCQQFAGAMALLLRMGGIPARVAVGFTPGTYDSATHDWRVTDLDAHAWVEAWFPTYGWVRFDPTPSTAPARGGHIEPILKKQTAGRQINGPDHNRDSPSTAGGPSAVIHGSGSSSDTPWVVLALVLLAGIIVVALFRRGSERTGEQLLAELERAFRRSGRPVGDGVTLAALEERLRGSREAQAYVRAIRMHRFAHGARTPTVSERRAVRRQLASGGGPLGRLRALWALPPHSAPRGSSRPGADVQSQ
jgi:transglutaminase-like putative cysteine protease